MKSVLSTLSLLTMLAVSTSARAGWSEVVLHVFTDYPTDGSQPFSSVVFDRSGNLYSTSVAGGSYGDGTAFELTKPKAGEVSWNERILHSFGGNGPGFFDGDDVGSGLIFDKKGDLFGTDALGAANLLGSVFELSPQANKKLPYTESLLYSFNNQTDDAAEPSTGVIFDKAGDVIGTTKYTANSRNGTVYMLSPPVSLGSPWTETILYRFTGGNDGSKPLAGLIADGVGNLYGTTSSGGEFGAGTVFELVKPRGSKPAWTERVLYSFKGSTDGGFPYASVVFDSAGNLYGTTNQGGNMACGGGTGCGTVFKLMPADGLKKPWNETVLYAFTGFRYSQPDGANPQAGLVFDGVGNLYGTTYYGGVASCGNQEGCGTVFELSPPNAGTAWTETLLYTFTGPDGRDPAASVVFDNSGNLFGTTVVGGASSCLSGLGCGVVFELMKR